MPDTLILMVLALVVFGPRRLPKIGRQLGKLMYEFRKASNDFKFQMEEELRQSEEAERRQKEELERQRALAAAPPAPQLEQSTTQSAETASTPESQSSASAGGESSYSGEAPPLRDPDQIETSYPDPAADATRSEEASPPLAEQDSSGEPTITPRIQPPSTGEKVAADHPNAQPEQRELFGGDTAKAPESVTPEAERSEPAAHHG